MQYNYFLTLTNLEDCKKKYKELAKQLHPDTQTGDEEKFKAMKTEYDFIVGGDARFPLVNVGVFPPFWTVRKQQEPEPHSFTEQHLNNLKASNYYKNKRYTDIIYDVIDDIISQADTKGKGDLYIYQQIFKLYELEVDHFKYLCWIRKKGNDIAFQLYKKYVTDKIKA